ncbi:MAG TPA: peptidoglycan DD-metalloendopeptidase family protein [Gammaproteobacteria bacterium]|nr:peptidoglycan DD-metalloendopeptidase family protein [Gammaproteobacteria bacterium]
MNIILFKKGGSPLQLNLAHWPVLAGAVFGIVLLLSGAGAGGYFLALQLNTPEPHQEIQQMRAMLVTQEHEIEQLRRTGREDVHALAVRLAQAQAQLIRLDALGQRLVKMADLDPAEFDFNSQVALGGPETTAEQGEVGTGTLPQVDFLSELDTLAQRIDKRETQLSVLENLLMNRNLQKQVLPTGWPIEDGWLSSQYGYRTDPFTGRKAWHSGLDFAGAKGSDIVAVASGVVTWAGPRYGYGNLIEINHGNGYVTRYGHNYKILVEVGETVKRGQVISKMGSTGRSTGPHVHFEVIKNGHVTNPIPYIRD